LEKKNKKLFSWRDFLFKRGERPKRRKKGSTPCSYFHFRFFLSCVQVGCRGIPALVHSSRERDKSMGFMNPLTSYSLF
jgi:hypothetical protein